MKTTDRNFAVKIDGKVFTGNEIYKIEIDGTRFNLDCGCESGTNFKISGNTKNLEFVGNIPNAREWEGYEMCGDRGFYGPPFGSHKNDTDMVTPLKQINQALHQTMGISEPEPNTATEASRIANEKMLRETYARYTFFGSLAKRIDADNEVEDAIKQMMREAMTEETVQSIRIKKDKSRIYKEDFEKLMKKYKQDQGRRSGGD